MTIKNCAAGRYGFVRGVVSRRHSGVVFPLDLVRVVARSVSRSALQRRIDREFSGYLVTEPAELPVWRGSDGRIVLICADLSTGSDLVHGVRGFDYGAAGTGCLDAPAYVAGGGCMPYVAAFNEVCASQLMIARGGM